MAPFPPMSGPCPASPAATPVRSGLALGGAETECLLAFHGQLQKCEFFRALPTWYGLDPVQSFKVEGNNGILSEL